MSFLSNPAGAARSPAATQAKRGRFKHLQTVREEEASEDSDGEPEYEMTEQRERGAEAEG